MISDSVNILGQKWKIVVIKAKECPDLKNLGGFCDNTVKALYIRKQHEHSHANECYDLREYERGCLRHEIIHAFLYESGLAHNSCSARKWAMNEEMVDWIAQQHEKIHAAFIEAGAINPDTI